MAAAMNSFYCFYVSFCTDILADGKEMSFHVAWDVCSSSQLLLNVMSHFFLIKPLISYPLTIFAWKTVVATGNHDLPVDPFVWSWLTQDWVLLLFLYILIPSESSKQEAWKPLYTRAVPVVYFFYCFGSKKHQFNYSDWERGSVKLILTSIPWEYVLLLLSTMK